MAVGSLLAVILATASIVMGDREASAGSLPDAAVRAGTPAWERLAALSAELKRLEPGGSRTRARRAARAAAKALASARKQLASADVAAADAPMFDLAVVALAAQERWVDAVGSTLANPRSDLRDDLAERAKTAMRRTAVVDLHADLPPRTVAGTGRLLSVTSAKRRSGAKAGKSGRSATK